ncbi:MAG: hypothetical protein AAGE65_01665 [Planctomycetota bacterium]
MQRFVILTSNLMLVLAVGLAAANDAEKFFAAVEARDLETVTELLDEEPALVNLTMGEAGIGHRLRAEQTALI